MSFGTQWLFERPENSSRKQIISWWLARVPSYNLLLLTIGIVAWLLVLSAGSAAVKPGDDFEEPIAMILGPPIYAVFANLCYLLGPAFDVLFFTSRPSTLLFKSGLIFSSVLTALPGLWALVAWLITLHTGHKLS